MLCLPLSKILFLPDDGLGDLSGTGLVAEYHIFSKKLIWRKLDEKQIAERKVGVLPSLLTVIMIVTYFNHILSNDPVKLTPIQRLGDNYIIIPIILGVLLFLIIESIRIYKRNKFIMVNNPSITDQIHYLVEINEVTLRHNKFNQWKRREIDGDISVKQRIQIPYLGTVFAYLSTIIIMLPTLFWIYFAPATTMKFMAELLILSIIIALVPYFIWDVIVKGIVTQRLIKDLKLKYSEQSNNL